MTLCEQLVPISRALPGFFYCVQKGGIPSAGRRLFRQATRSLSQGRRKRCGFRDSHRCSGNTAHPDRDLCSVLIQDNVLRLDSQQLRAQHAR